MYRIKTRSNLWLAVLFMALSALFPHVSLALPVGWATSSIDTGDVGLYTSIAIDSNDHAHISYYDGTNRTSNTPRMPQEIGLHPQSTAQEMWDSSPPSQSTPITTCTSATTTQPMATSNTPRMPQEIGLHPQSTAQEMWDCIPPSQSTQTITCISATTMQPMATSNTPRMPQEIGLHPQSTTQEMWDSSTSIAIDSNNHVHISYYDATNGDAQIRDECLRRLGYIHNRQRRRCGTVLLHSNRLR